MSEEYNEFVNSFNDGFLLLIDGENVAKVPGTQDTVSIDTINNGVNSALFNDNEAIPADFNTEYDGFTTLLITSPVELIVGQVYAAKLVIADAFDSSVDSSLIIQGSSFDTTGKHNQSSSGIRRCVEYHRAGCPHSSRSSTLLVMSLQL